MATIPASNIVKITPSVLSAGGTALELNGVMLTTNARVPMGVTMAFGSPLDVANFFGLSSSEAALSTHYFLGFNNSSVKPGTLLFAQYAASAVSGYLRGGALPTLATLQGLSGTFTVVTDGASGTSGNIDLAAATSYSNAASIISTALSTIGSGAPTASYDTNSNAFVITSPTTGGSSSVSFATGGLSASLMLTAATGAVLSPGAVQDTPGGAMNRLLRNSTNWASFMTVWEPSTNDKIAFADWTNGTNNDYLYVCWDTDVGATTQGNTTNVGHLIKNADYSGTALIFKDVSTAAFLMGAVASLDFNDINGRATMAFRGQTGLTPIVTDEVVAEVLIANGYNFYGAYATANDQFNFLYPGSLSGPFEWIDSYVNEIWMSNQFQLALMVLLTSVKSIPYNAEGYAMIKAACLDVINQAISFGAIRQGVSLSQSQAVQVNSQAGVAIDATLSQKGWYLQVRDPTPQVRAARGSPPCRFWYMDGQSVQSINLNSVQVQ